MRRPLVAVLFVAVASSTGGEPGVAAPSRLSEMTYLAGSWSCKTTFAPGTNFAGSIFPLTTTAHRSYLTMDYGSIGIGRLTYDPHIKKFVYIETDNDGSYQVMTTTGWSGGKSAWTRVLASDGDLGEMVDITQKTRSAYDFDVVKPSGTLVVRIVCSKP
jgi:hypothetical protein